MRTTRRPVRLSHLTMAKAMKRMLHGPFTAADLVNVTGLHQATAYELVRALSSETVIRRTANLVDARGRHSIKCYCIESRTADPLP